MQLADKVADRHQKGAEPGLACAVLLPLRLEPPQWKTRWAQGQTPMQRLPELVAVRQELEQKLQDLAGSRIHLSHRCEGGRQSEGISIDYATSG